MKKQRKQKQKKQRKQRKQKKPSKKTNYSRQPRWVTYDEIRADPAWQRVFGSLAVGSDLVKLEIPKSREEVHKEIEVLRSGSTNAYHGESYGKKLARAGMYTIPISLWNNTTYPGGWAVTLAGPGAPEVGLIRDILNWDPLKTVYVDRDRSCVLEASLKTSSMCVTGDLGDVLWSMGSGATIGFIHLDFMGHITDDVYACIQELGPVLRPGGIILFTYLRGRETESNHRWLFGKSCSNSVLNNGVSLLEKRRLASATPKDRRDIIRVLSHSLNIATALGKGAKEVVCLGGNTYQSGSPMGILAFQYMPESMQGPKWVREVDKIMDVPTHHHSNDPQVFKDAVIGYRRKGIPAEVLAGIFSVTKGQIAAWLAHDTMGTYRRSASTG